MNNKLLIRHKKISRNFTPYTKTHKINTKYKKQSHIYNNRDRDDDYYDYDDDYDYKNDFSDFFLGGSDVTCTHNHIYFRCDVTMDTVYRLCEMIDQYNRDQYENTMMITTGIYVQKPLYLHITSIGGDLFAGLMAYDYIKASNVPIYTVAEGYAISAASLMYMAGKKRYMTESSYILIHQLKSSQNGDSTFHELVDSITNDIELMKRIYAIYLNNIRHNRENVPREDILTKKRIEKCLMHDILWNYDTCVRYGITDELYTNYNDVDKKDISDLMNNITLPTLENNISNSHIYSLDELTPSNCIVKKINSYRKENKRNKRKSKSDDEDDDDDYEPHHNRSNDIDNKKRKMKKLKRLRKNKKLHKKDDNNDN